MRNFARRFLALIPLVFVCTVACTFAPAANAQTPPQYLFGFQGGANPSIVTYTVDPASGQLTATSDPPAAPKSSVLNMTVNPAATFLFTTTVNSAAQGGVGVFTIASDGSLAELVASPFSGSSTGTPLSCSVSRDGNYLYLLSNLQALNSQGITSDYAVVDVFSIAPDGTLTIANTYTITGMYPYAMLVHATGSWLYVWGDAGLGDHASSIEQFTVGPSGTLTDNGPFTLQSFSTPPMALVGDNFGTFLYGSYQQYGGGSVGLIDSLAVNSVNGSLSIASNFNNTTGYTSSNLAVASTSGYLYSTADSYSIADGVLTFLNSFTPPSTIIAPTLLASPTTPFLFESGESVQEVEFVTSQVIGTDGSLTNAPGSPYGFVFVALAVTGVAPVPIEPILRPNANSIVINNIVVGQTGTGTVVVTNWGYSPLTLSNVSVSGDPSLSQTNTCTSALPPMGTCQVTINFVPTSAGTFDGTLTLESNAPTESVSITATSQNPAPNPAILPSQQILFPDTALGSSSSLTIELENYTGATETLTVSGMTWAGSNPGDFSETNNCTSPIAVGTSCSVNITFTPLALGNRAALLNITTNAPYGGIVQATISGNSVTTVTKYSFSTVINGPGTVAQTPTGASLANNTTITLTATPNANSSFVIWAGVCPGSYGVTCTFVLNANTVATANFAANVTLTTMVVGPGTITQSPTGTSFEPGVQILLTAFPNAGAQFVSWTSSSGCLTGTPPTECIVTLNVNTTVTATFSAPQVSLTTSAVGPGTIQQTPSGTSFNPGTSITLTAVPNANATFTDWSGECAGSTNTACTFMITANTSVTATFAAAPTVTPSQTSQSGSAGTAFTFQINESGFSTKPTLTATCSIPAGGCSISGSTLTVTTMAPSPSTAVPSPPAPGVPSLMQFRWSIASLTLMLILLAGTLLPLAARRARRVLGAAALVGGLALLAACGGSGGSQSAPYTPAGTYPITVTATAGAQTATTTVSVIVQ